MKPFRVVFMPFPMSDATTELMCDGTDEEYVRDYYKRNFPMYRIVSITEEA